MGRESGEAETSFLLRQLNCIKKAPSTEPYLPDISLIFNQMLTLYDKFCQAQTQLFVTHHVVGSLKTLTCEINDFHGKGVSPNPSRSRKILPL